LIGHESHRLPTPTNPELAIQNESISLKYGKTIRDGKLATSTCPLENVVIDLLESPTYPPASQISRFFQSLRQNYFLEWIFNDFFYYLIKYFKKCARNLTSMTTGPGKHESNPISNGGC
jgi:hypothetical protein